MTPSQVVAAIPLLALAERVEEAKGPDRELDCAIAVAVLGFVTEPPRYEGGDQLYCYTREDGGYVRPGQAGDQLVPDFTASLDAAMQLAGGLERYGGAAGMLREAMDRLSALPVLVSRMSPDEYRDALARFYTAACLRAKALGES